MEYTTDHIGEIVRKVGMALSTIQDDDEIAAWISDILMGSTQDDKDKAISILSKIQDDMDWR